MTTAIFDTLAYSKKLRAVGFTEQQAEVQAEALIELIDEKLATKDDIQALELATKADIQELAIATKNDIQELAIATKNDIQELDRKIDKLAETTKRDFKEFTYKLTIQTGLMLAGAVALLSAIIKL